MNALLLLVLLSISPVSWDGSVWVRLDTNAKLSYVTGFIGGIELASEMENDPAISIASVPPEEILASLDIFYLDTSLFYVPIPQAIFTIGKRRN